MARPILIALLFAALTACSPHPAATSGGGPAPAPADAPTWVKVYPGGVITRSQFGQVANGVAGSLEYTTAAAPGDVNAFYAQSAAANGFKPGGHLPGNSFTDAAETRTFSVSMQPSGVGTVDVTVIARSQAS